MYGAKLFMRSNLNINKPKSRFFLHFNAMQNGQVLKKTLMSSLKLLTKMLGLRSQ